MEHSAHLWIQLVVRRISRGEMILYYLIMSVCIVIVGIIAVASLTISKKYVETSTTYPPIILIANSLSDGIVEVLY